MGKRIQRKRTKGWRMPPNTVYVGGGSKWGNPYKVGGYYQITLYSSAAMAVKIMAEYQEKYPNINFYRSHDSWSFFRFDIIDNYTAKMVYWFLINRYYSTGYFNYLKGKNLACWCPLGQPCHADVLLKIANEKEQ